MLRHCGSFKAGLLAVQQSLPQRGVSTELVGLGFSRLKGVMNPVFSFHVSPRCLAHRDQTIARVCAN
jgi:hypothetical protein